MRLLTATVLIFVMFVTLSFSGDIQTLKKKIEIGSEQSIEVNMDMGLADITVSPGDGKYIVQAVVIYDADYIKQSIDYTPGKNGVLDIESKKRKGSIEHWDDVKNEWELIFTTEVPMEFNLDLGLGECEMDLSKILLTDVDFDIGLSELYLEFNKPNKQQLDRMKIDTGLGEVKIKGLLNANFEEFVFSGGLGSSELYFTGENSRVCEAKIEVGLGSLEIYLQAGLPVKVISESSFLSSINIEDMKKIRKGVHVSRDWDEDAPNRLILTLEVGLGSITVEWD